MAHDEHANNELLMGWSREKKFTLAEIREIYVRTPPEIFVIPERIGRVKVPTNDTFKHYCRYWWVNFFYILKNFKNFNR